MAYSMEAIDVATSGLDQKTVRTMRRAAVACFRETAEKPAISSAGKLLHSAQRGRKSFVPDFLSQGRQEITSIFTWEDSVCRLKAPAEVRHVGKSPAEGNFLQGAVGLCRILESLSATLEPPQ